MTQARAVACLIAAALLTCGCLPEDLGGGLDIANETDRTLYFDDVPIPPGETFRYAISDCSDSDLTVRTSDDEVVAEETDEWCPGQTWTIAGADDSRLGGP